MSEQTPKIDPIRPTDDEARALARGLIDEALFAALATVTDGAPMVTRIALACDPAGIPLTLVSQLAAHTAPLLAGRPASLMVGEPGGKGDPLTHPRLTIQCRPEVIDRASDAFEALSAHYVAERPKSKLYIGFADFLLVRFHPEEALLNGGFGKAFRLTPADLGL